MLRPRELTCSAMLAVLLMLCTLFTASCNRVPSARQPRAAIGEALEIRHNDEDYLGKNWQIVSVITPKSGGRRILDHKTGNFTGMKRRQGMVHWVKKREQWPFERLQRQPFKVRIFKADPAGIVTSMVQEGKLVMAQSLLTAAVNQTAAGLARDDPGLPRGEARIMSKVVFRTMPMLRLDLQ